MAWNPQVLFKAFERAGMLDMGIHLPSATPFTCRLNQPDLLILGEQHQSTAYEIEYETAAVPPMREGDQVQVTCQGVTATYTVRNSPNAQGDGYYTKAELSKV